MSSRLRSRRSLTIVACIIATVAMWTNCIDSQSGAENIIQNAAGEMFAGSATCANCHKEIFESHLRTAHFLTSQPAGETYVKGSFRTGENTFILNERVHVTMEKRNDSFYQVAYLDGVEKQANSIDIVIGSGTKGQTYLDWTGNQLFQLPISYFTLANHWTNSPGYPGMIVYNRPITSRCLECHTTFAQKISDGAAAKEEFNPKKFLYGVDCEKCHGPAAAHVAFQSEHSMDTIGKYIVNPGTLSRRQHLDLCTLCHGGRLKKTKPSFSFQAGDSLYNFFSHDTSNSVTADIDVHGNQYGLMAASKCFKMSEMTCTSCHNVHQNEKNKLAVISQRCLNCHSAGHVECKMSKQIGTAIYQNCIDCHMPKQASRSITVLLQGSEIPSAALMRTHLIKVYPDETKKFLDSFKIHFKSNQ